MKRTALAIAATVSCFALANGVLAQTAAPAGDQRDQRRQERVQRFCDDLDARFNGRIAFLQSRLKITDQQRGPWNNYVEAARKGLDPMRQDCAAGKVAQRPTTLPDRLTEMQRRAEQQAAQLRSLKPAVDTLYATLSPDQKQTADRVLLNPMGGRGPGPGPRRG